MKSFFHPPALKFLFAAWLISQVQAAEIKQNPDWKILAEAYIQKAHKINLSEHDEWLKLLHYHKTLFNTLSDIDGGYFFLAEKGKTDSRAELEATLRAFFTLEDTHVSTTLADSVEFHPLTKFPARLRFLKKQLGIKEQELPPIDRSRFTKWRDKINAVGASLVFASGYLNNPASAFGHTFLKIHSGNRNNQKSPDLLNYVINYSADAESRGGILYAVKGIFGGYHGYFSIMPYYVALQKYSRLESRDIWEYKLNLSQQETDYLLEHLWEMGDVWMNYLFFTENCSYNLLTILEVVKPGYELVDDFTMKVVPIETVRDVYKYPELIDTIIYRPAMLTTFKYRLSKLNASQKSLFKFMYRNSKKEPSKRVAASSDYSREDSVKVYDVWLDLVQYLKRQAKNDKRKEKITRLQRELLVARSKIKLKNEFKPEWVTRPAHPLARHKPSIMHLAAGRYRGRKYLELGSGMVNYDLNSFTRGTSGNLDIKYLDFKVKLYSKMNSSFENLEYDDYHLENFKILEIKSLEPSRNYLQHISWHFNSGFDSPKISGEVFRNSLMAQAGAGKTYPLPWSLGKIYSLLELKARIAPWMKSNHSFGPEWRSGIKLNLTPKASLLARYVLFNPLTGESYRESILNWQLRFFPTTNSELVLEDNWHREFRQLQLSINYYL